MTGEFNEKCFEAVRLDLDLALHDFKRLFYVENQDFDLPVAFATNTLYILTRNNLITQSGDLV